MMGKIKHQTALFLVKRKQSQTINYAAKTTISQSR